LVLKFRALSKSYEVERQEEHPLYQHTAKTKGEEGTLKMNLNSDFV